ncbi:MAG: Rid family detoxifying hydrolase [Bifidobacteriaceae bacterium]|jgi:2-iminobutanoate/2-iminopropanoate deaminase|nr:Rid family detoxifying hydrolase [Bifidobacteriaceae bacterium]
MRITRVEAAGAPAAIGPYSQAVVAGPFVFVSGQLALDPATGALVGADAGEQAAQALRNVAAILGEIGLGLDDAVKTTIFLTDMADFAAVNAAYAEHFDHEPRPARSTVAVAGLPKGAAVEIEVVAVFKG